MTNKLQGLLLGYIKENNPALFDLAARVNRGRWRLQFAAQGCR